jgi:hypothetical protein
MKVIFFVLMYNQSTKEYRSVYDAFSVGDKDTKNCLLEWVEKRLKENRDFIVLNMRII